MVARRLLLPLAVLTLGVTGLVGCSFDFGCPDRARILTVHNGTEGFVHVFQPGGDILYLAPDAVTSFELVGEPSSVSVVAAPGQELEGEVTGAAKLCCGSGLDPACGTLSVHGKKTLQRDIAAPTCVPACGTTGEI